MPWPTWEQAGVCALVSVLVGFVLSRGRDPRGLAPAAYEFALVSGLYTAWRLAKQIPLGNDEGAIERARSIVEFQTYLHLPTELSVQQFVLQYDWLGRLVSAYYGILHVPALLAFMVWLFVRHREHYPHWRNGLALLTAGCLAIRWVRVAPPRYLTDLGYQDLSELFGPSVYGEVGTGVSDQFTAMPSIHVGWAAVVSFGIFAATRSRWRWFFLLHVVITMIVVSATGHHWWLDGAVALVLLWGGLRLDTAVRRSLDSRRGTTADAPTSASTPAQPTLRSPVQ
ncbi:phosphatase PAP2 family protein [Nocardioides salsibiostraticola]